GILVAEGGVDIDELIAAFARAGLDVLDQRLERLADRAGVGGLVELRDVAPRSIDVLDRHGAAEAERLARRALPAQLRKEAAAHLEQRTGLLAGLVDQ